VVVYDDLGFLPQFPHPPADLTEQRFLASGSVSQGSVTIPGPIPSSLTRNVGTLASGASARMTIPRTVAGTGSLTQAADVVSDRPDQEGSNHVAYTPTQVLVGSRSDPE
jgi:hypothetical protein